MLPGCNRKQNCRQGCFYFLPPIVKNPDTSGVFNSPISPVVEIVDLSLNGTYDPEDQVIVTFTVGEGSEYIRVILEDEQYIVNWHTKNFVLFTTVTYRIRVLLEPNVVGFADVVVVNSGKKLKTLDADEKIVLKNGRTIPIKFRIEEVTVNL